MKYKKPKTFMPIKEDESELDLTSLAEQLNQENISAKKVSDRLEEISDAVGAHGVEVVRSQDHWDNYYGDVIAEYINMGDSYALTIVYDTRTGTFAATSWGDWMEKHEAEKEAEKAEENKPETYDADNFEQLAPDMKRILGINAATQAGGYKQRSGADHSAFDQQDLAMKALKNVNENSMAPEAKEFMGSEKLQAAKGENGLVGSVENAEGQKTPESKDIKTMLDRMKQLANIKSEKPDLQWDDAGISTPGSLMDQPKEVDPVDVVRVEKETGAPSIEILKQELRPENPIITKTQPKADSSSSNAPKAEKSEAPKSEEKGESQKPWEKKTEGEAPAAKADEKKEKVENKKEEKSEEKEEIEESVDAAIEEVTTHNLAAKGENIGLDIYETEEEEVSEEVDAMSDDEILESDNTELMYEAMIKYKNEPQKFIKFKRKLDEITSERRLTESLRKMRLRF